MLRGTDAHSPSISQDDLNKALEVLDSLLQLQEERYSHSPSKQAVARAETLKLTGNVHLALAEYQRWVGARAGSACLAEQGLTLNES